LKICRLKAPAGVILALVLVGALSSGAAVRDGGAPGTEGAKGGAAASASPGTPRGNLQVARIVNRLKAESSLFSLANLGPVDLSAKEVEVEVYVAPGPEQELFAARKDKILERVRKFYARMGVAIKWSPGRAEPGVLAPASRLRLEVLGHREFLAKSFKAFQVPEAYSGSFLQSAEYKFSFAHLPLSTAHISFDYFKKNILDRHPEAAALHEAWAAHLIAHELGHLLGLYHAHEFINDPTHENLLDEKHPPNFMGRRLCQTGEAGFGEFQQRLVHSYLGRGKVFEQYRYVKFDPLRYLQLIKQYNHFREASSEGEEEQRR
jgi:hypothetical protein